jgi:hypothetical protein
MLAERGFTYRTGEGHLYLPAAVGGGFEDKNTHLIEELLAAARRLESLLTVQPTPPGSPRSDRRVSRSARTRRASVSAAPLQASPRGAERPGDANHED